MEKSNDMAKRAGASRFMPWVIAGLAILLAAGIRLRLADMPLERDEGEYAYAGQLMLDGLPPYSLAYNMKFPGTYAAYAVIMAVFGQTVAGIHIGVMIVNAASSILIFLLAKRLLDAWAGAAAAACHAVTTMLPGVLGLAGHATHFVMLAALGGIMVLLVALDRPKRLFVPVSGFLLGVAILMKQPGAAFLAFAALYLAWRHLRARPVNWRRLAADEGMLALGAAVPLAATALALRAAGVFDTFWFWTIDYAREYGSIVPLSESANWFVQGLEECTGAAAGIWTLGAVGLVAAAWDRRVRAAAPLLGGLLVFSFIATSAGFYYRNHYFLLLLPALSILAGVLVSSAAGALGHARLPRFVRWMPGAVLAAACGYVLLAERAVLFEETPERACRSVYGMNPFPEAVKIAKYVADRASPSDRIAVVGSEPEIYFYAHRRSATGYIYTYGLMEPQPYARRMQLEMIREIEASQPRFLITVHVPTSWLAGPDSDMTIFQWLSRYGVANYEQVGVIDMQSADYTVYRWNEEAAGYRPLSPFWLAVFRRTR